MSVQTSVQPIPKGYHTITPYLILPRLGGFLEFLQKAFGAQVVEKYGEGDAMMHAAVKLGDSMLMMGGASDQFPAQPGGIHLYVPDADATYRSAIAAGATSIREPETQFYGDRSSGVRDGWGNVWWISTHVEDVSPEEMKRRMSQRQG